MTHTLKNVLYNVNVIQNGISNVINTNIVTKFC